MKLSVRILLIVLLTWFLMFAITYLVSWNVLKPSYLSLEHAQALETLTQARKTLSKQIDVVQSSVVSNGNWDESYNFIQNKNPKFILTNYNPDNMVSYFDIIMFRDKNNKLVGSSAINLAGKATPVPAGILDLFRPQGKLNPLLQDFLTKKFTGGYIFYKGNILLIGASPVYKVSQPKLPPDGSVTIIKYLTPDMWKKIRDISKLDLTLFLPAEINANPKLTEIYQSLLKQKTVLTQTHAHTLVMYDLLNDITGQPIALLKLIIPRYIFPLALDTMYYFYGAFILIGILFSMLIFLLLRFLIVKRLQNMHNKVAKINQSQDFTQRIAIKGTDELTSVSKNMNQMFHTISENNEQKQTLLNNLNHQLKQVQNYSMQFHETEALLSDVINSMPAFLIIVDKKNQILNLNLIAAKELSMDVEAAKGKSLFALFPYLQSHAAILNQCIENNIAQRIDKLIYSTADKTYYFSVLFFPLLRGTEQLLGIRIDDIYEHVQFEELLLQNTRLASIGVLTAGVAHEINNPINFVRAAISPLKKNVEDMLNIFQQYQNIKIDESIQSQLQAIEENKKNLELDYSIKETHDLVMGIKDGATRTAVIAKGLTAFSRADKDIFRQENIHTIIDSVLTLLLHTYKNRIVITKHYADIPDIDCYPEKLSQVFMNIISNAVDAISDQGNIIIETKQFNGNIAISIQDSGIGISEENRAKIFDPFFTTKEVGKGIGLGLSVTSSIIRDHNGSIDVKSQIGKGTEFIITLPITQNKSV